ncbi:hypothetical protein FOC33_17070 [Plesiomonas shigelloides]|uniref:hypothetical protein n=1 Tax=Bacteria TaxID=2 RepID=UPI00143E2C03|nr:hypothetical protein [Plesiomonas shigelloides]EKE6106451.1 hypothetical protein [Vibrio cholerae]QIY10414.1 hypothetical protein FOC33_16855 [Plesiomonas shigelloides]QIY10451.1 hypothetical protein FOC33_17070 [Plesiomonas shigelloides]
MSKKDNVVVFPTHKLKSLKSKVDETTTVPSQEQGSVSISERLRTTIDDGLKQQMREQMRKQHGLEQQ